MKEKNHEGKGVSPQSKPPKNLGPRRDQDPYQGTLPGPACRYTLRPLGALVLTVLFAPFPFLISSPANGLIPKLLLFYLLLSPLLIGLVVDPLDYRGRVTQFPSSLETLINLASLLYFVPICSALGMGELIIVYYVFHSLESTLGHHVTTMPAFKLAMGILFIALILLYIASIYLCIRLLFLHRPMSIQKNAKPTDVKNQKGE